MKLLKRYIMGHILAGIGIVTLALTGLQIFILFVRQLPDIGKGSYDFYSATLVVACELPYNVYTFFPVASLLGVLFGLGVMANNSELVVMRAAGVSVAKIASIVLKIAFVLMIGVTFVGESLIPKFNKLALDTKVLATSGGQTVRTQYGVWVRENNDYLFIGTGLSDKKMLDVLQFHFDSDHNLAYTRKIKRLEFIDNNWQAFDVAETKFYPDNTQITEIAKMQLEGITIPSKAYFSTTEPPEMTFKELQEYINAHKALHQNVDNETLIFWQRIVQPFSTLVMMMLGIPFIFGPLRSSTMGSRMLLGGSSGFVFYTFDHFIGPMSQVLQLPQVIAATLPTILFMLIGAVLLTKVR